MRVKLAIMFSLAWLVMSIGAAQAGPFGSGGMQMPKCTVCHSKNQDMRAMHAALEYKDCFLCHGPGGLWPEEKRTEQKAADPECARCHGGPVDPISPISPVNEGNTDQRQGRENN